MLNPLVTSDHLLVDVCRANLRHFSCWRSLDSIVTQDENCKTHVFYINPAKQLVWVRPGDPITTFVRREEHGDKQFLSFWFCVLLVTIYKDGHDGLRDLSELNRRGGSATRTYSTATFQKTDPPRQRHTSPGKSNHAEACSAGPARLLGEKGHKEPCRLREACQPVDQLQAEAVLEGWDQKAG
ncbi:unnamed protein product [Nippostrongylus brasiliensis]|uniref:FERM domain-containing protein n=1 Tax=Nippostrongylus brasiliensis TaxID=27835 RepID=A0A0N4XV67_NIPBR|nr:unnamed protein product [Nippostrongylus brasiliensis]